MVSGNLSLVDMLRLLKTISGVIIQRCNLNSFYFYLLVYLTIALSIEKIEGDMAMWNRKSVRT